MRRVVWVVVFLGIWGCAGTEQHGTSSIPRTGAVQEGIASWYGPGFHGNPTASGEIYDQNDLTAAHQTLPLGTRVAVTNLANGRSIEVKINDRGPFVDGRILDLSYAAARSLGMIEPGTTRVRIEILGPAPVGIAAAYAVQVGSFANADNATGLQKRLRQRFDNVYVSPFVSEAGHYYRVRLGRFARREQAVRLANEVSDLGLPAVIMEDGVVESR